MPVFVWKFAEVIFPHPRLPCLSLSFCCLLFVQPLPAPGACGYGRCPLDHGSLSVCFFFIITDLCALCSTRTRHVFTELGYTGQRVLLTEDSNRHAGRISVPCNNVTAVSPAARKPRAALRLNSGCLSFLAHCYGKRGMACIHQNMLLRA
jgi:hypothetical protein